MTKTQRERTAEYDKYWRDHQAKRAVWELEDMLSDLSRRAELRETILAKHGFDIGTREEANTRTGPYADQANLDRIALFYQEKGVGTVGLD